MYFRKKTAAFIFFFTLGLVSLLAITSAASGVNGFDEPIQFIGLKSTLEHAESVWKFKNPDFNTIHSNLEFYGIAPRLPAYILWTIAKLMTKILDPSGNLGLSDHAGNSLVDAYKSGYFAISHLVSIGYLAGIALITNRVARKLGLHQPEIAGVMILLYPALLGFSLISVKDTAFAFFYSLYSYSLALVWQGWLHDPIQVRRKSWIIRICLHGCVAGILISITTSILFIVLLSELIFFFIFLFRHKILPLFFAKQATLAIGLAALSWLLLSPPAWLNPLSFLITSINYSLDGSQAWGGCMHFLNECPRKGDAWNTLSYMKNWLFSGMPLMHLLGLAFALGWICVAVLNLSLLAKSRLQRWLGNTWLRLDSTFLLALVLQAFFIPATLLVVNGFIYDGIRHLLFIIPPLAIFSYWGVVQTLISVRRRQRLLLSVVLILASLTLLIDLMLLHPYQYTYFNELAMLRGVNWKNTDIEFYYASDAESLRNFMRTDRFSAFASQGGIDVKGAPPLDHAYHVENFPRKRGHALFFTNHTREPGVMLRKDCEQAGKNVARKQLFGPFNIYGTPQVCSSSSYRDWDPF